jgi:ferredoxin-type protein NapF
MLKITRTFLAVLSFADLCLLFLDTSGTLPTHLAFLGKIQLIPAFLSGSFAAVAALLVLTLVFGRVYCSVLCPLGVLQDVLARAGRKGRFRFVPGKTVMRVVAFVVFTGAFFTGVPMVFALMEPYSSFGRIATDLAAPVWQSGNNLLALMSERVGSFAVASTPILQKGLAGLFAAIATLAVIGFLAWKSGRTWCNTVCPVGTALGFLSRFSLFKPHIDKQRCVHCGLCVKSCKAHCIDGDNGDIDSSRCVSCFNCLSTCRREALAYVPAWTARAQAGKETSSPDLTRRTLLTAMVAVGAPVMAFAKDKNKPIPALTRKTRPERNTPIIPPGSTGLKAFTERCTGCQLCVSTCPNQVLSSFDRGEGMLQPALSFEHGFCRVNCVNCSTVCPTGAIRPITVEEKSSTQIGRAYINYDACIVNKDKVACTSCFRNCPPKAITLVGDGEIKTPVVDNERCTGCGACEYLCPARPFSAIWVEGNLEHRRV